MHLHRAPPARRIRHVIRGIRYDWAIVLRVPVFKILRRQPRVNRHVPRQTARVHIHRPIVGLNLVMDILRVVAVLVTVRGVIRSLRAPHPGRVQ